MGTNFYFVHINSEELKEDITKLQCKYPFAKISVQDRIHIAKTSAGWKPLFHSNEYFKSVKDIKDAYYLSDYAMCIQDEYGKTYNWEEFEERVIKFNPNGLSHILNEMYSGGVEENYHADKEGYEFYSGDWS